MIKLVKIAQQHRVLCLSRGGDREEGTRRDVSCKEMKQKVAAICLLTSICCYKSLVFPPGFIWVFSWNLWKGRAQTQGVNTKKEKYRNEEIWLQYCSESQQQCQIWRVTQVVSQCFSDGEWRGAQRKLDSLKWMSSTRQPWPRGKNKTKQN